MPGLTLWMKALPDAQDRIRFDAAQAAMVHAPDYAATVCVSQPGLLVGHVNYAEYPIQFLNAEGCVIGFEGCVYNKDAAQLDSDLREIAALADQDSAELAARIGRWTQEAQGEYVVVMLWPEKKRLMAFTDPFGRLPLYFYADDACLLLAREAKVVQRLKPSPRFDRIGWAQTIWVGFPLAQRTLFEDVSRCPAAMLLSASAEGGRIRTQVRSLFTFRFDETDEPGRDIEDYAREVVASFTNVCRTWGRHPGFTRNVLSLSGGHDSRAIAGALTRAGIEYDTATLQDASGDNIANVPLAQEVARLLGVHWSLSKLKEPDQALMDRLVEMKDGLNYVGIADMVEYTEGMAATWGRKALCLTGDGGDRVLPSLQPPRGITSLDALAGTVARRFTRTSMDLAERLTRLQPGTLAGELRQTLQACPEEDLAQRLTHFALYEHSRKWLYEGEDRYRFFLWQTSPFFSFPFFRDCMRIPNRLKVGNRLYRKVLAGLCPECDGVAFSVDGVHTSAAWMACRRMAADVLPESIKAVLRQSLRRRRYATPKNAVEYLRAQFASGTPLSALLSEEALAEFLGNTTQNSFQFLWTLVTLERLSRRATGA